MKPFNYFQPKEFHFGSGRVAEIAEVVGDMGSAASWLPPPQKGNWLTSMKS
jgi:hypothetical protein